MVNSLMRVGVGQSSTPETRKLATEVAECLVQWEKQCIQQSQQKTAAEDASVPMILWVILYC